MGGLGLAPEPTVPGGLTMSIPSAASAVGDVESLPVGSPKLKSRVPLAQLDAEGVSSSNPPADAEELLGKRVLVTGLVRQPEFNGQWGIIEKYDEGLQRFVVRVLRDSGPPVLAKLRR